MLIGEDLARWRRRHEITQQELAEIVGVSVQTIYRWEMPEDQPEARRPSGLSEPNLERAMRRVERRGSATRSIRKGAKPRHLRRPVDSHTDSHEGTNGATQEPCERQDTPQSALTQGI